MAANIRYRPPDGRRRGESRDEYLLRKRTDARLYRAKYPLRMQLRDYAARANKRAEKLGAPGRLTYHDLEPLIGPCVYCGIATRSFDHVVPMAQGGANTVANLVPCCVPCNVRKRSDQREWVAAIFKRLERPAKFGRAACGHARERYGQMCFKGSKCAGIAV